MGKKNQRRHRIEATTRPAGINNRADAQGEAALLFLKRVIGAVLLFPLALITAITLCVMLWRACRDLEFWRSAELVFFALGGLSWWAIWLCGIRPVTTYVFGHEMSHYFVAKLFGGVIFDWKVGADGGYVETNKSNTWITLAPYLLPFYTIIVLGLFGVVGIFLDLHSPVRLGPVKMVPALVFYYLVGLTWWFHATYTARTVRIEQGDLRRNGEFFSMMLIFLVNVALLMLMLLAASPSPALGLGEVVRCWCGVAAEFFDFLLPG